MIARESDRWHMAQGWLCARKPNSARLARAELHDWGHAPEPSPADRGWLGVMAAKVNAALAA